MSKDKFDEACRGCKPAMLDLKTNEVLPDDHPHMVIILELWALQSPETKQAWHRVTCQNSRDPKDQKLAEEFINKYKAKLGAIQA